MKLQSDNSSQNQKIGIWVIAGYSLKADFMVCSDSLKMWFMQQVQVSLIKHNLSQLCINFYFSASCLSHTSHHPPCTTFSGVWQAWDIVLFKKTVVSECETPHLIQTMISKPIWNPSLDLIGWIHSVVKDSQHCATFSYHLKDFRYVLLP